MPGPEDWQAFAGVVAVLIFLGGGVFALRRLGILGSPAPPAKADDDRVAALEARVAELEQGHTRTSALLEALPDSREFNKVAQGVTAVQGDVKAVQASLQGVDNMVKGLAAQVSTLNAHLLGKSS